MLRHSLKSRFSVNFMLVLCCAINNISFANSTLALPFPETGHDSQNPSSIEQLSGYDSNNHYDFPKKPPYGRGGFSNLQQSLWLVPVLRYLITVNGDSIQMEAVPAVFLLPVLLQTASNWWFHEQQVLEVVDNKKETAIGSPFLYMEEPVDGGGGQNSKTETPKADSCKKTDSRDKTEPSVKPTSSTQTNQQDRKKEDKTTHVCNSNTCPACNHGPCHCQECVKAMETELLHGAEEQTTTASPVRKTHSLFTNPVNIVLILEQRRATGSLQARSHPILAQEALSAAGPVEPEVVLVDQVPWFNCRCRYPYYCECSQTSLAIRGVLAFEGGSLLSWTDNGIKVWSVSKGNWSSSEIPLYDGKIHVVFVTQNHRIMILFKNGDLQEWSKMGDGFWKGRNIATEISRIKQLSNNEFVVFSRSNSFLGIWKYDGDNWLFSHIPGEDIHDLDEIIVISESRFATILKRVTEQKLTLWSKKNNLLISEIDYKAEPHSEIDINILSDGARFVIYHLLNRIFSGLAVWNMLTQNWSALPESDWVELIHGNNGILHNNRLHTEKSEKRILRSTYYHSLLLFTEENGEWKPTELFDCPEGVNCKHCITTLNDGRLAIASSFYSEDQEDSIQVFLQTGNGWISAILGYSSFVVGMAELQKGRLTTWHSNGEIKIWNLIPQDLSENF